MTGLVYEEATVRPCVSPAVRTNGTVNGAAVDRATAGGAGEAIVAVISGAITDGSHAIQIEDSDTGSGGWAAVPAVQLQGTQPLTLTSANANGVFEVGVSSSRRFLRVNVVTTGATTGGSVAAVVVLGDLRQSPLR